jgi:DNA-binding transcriptional LysR family regulator
MEIPDIRIRPIRICMHWQNITFDWNQIRAFLVTAEEGSLSAAARALGLTQPTLSRQVAALEKDLGVTLFERSGRALTVTETGRALLDQVRTMGEAAGAISRIANGQSQAIEGEVRITATATFSALVLPRILAQLARIAPAITVTLVADDSIRNLERREADIALRHAAPTEPDLITRRLRSGRAHFCAAQSYLDRFGPIAGPSDLARADWIGYGNRELMARTFSQFGVELRPEQFRYISENGFVMMELIRAGLGISVLTDELRAAAPDLVVKPVDGLYLSRCHELCGGTQGVTHRQSDIGAQGPVFQFERHRATYSSLPKQLA